MIVTLMWTKPNLMDYCTWQFMVSLQTLPKAQRTRGLSSGYQSKFFRSYHKFSNKSRSDFIFILPTKQQLQNLNPISAFRLNLNFKILTKPSFRISTKNNLHNLSQGSAAKYWLNFSFKIVPEPQLQSWPNLGSKSGQKVDFMTKLHLPSLHQTIVNTFLSINISNFNNLNKHWVDIFTRQGHINQVY